ncbi:haloacid dehalogenase-like hydrolase family protein [Actinidia rufa]|uniref:Haloacid dehalogenase-like hydrolase family protein n=1 Tax=Actinidia rufa TaxID=165716 RepID=A0A7J0DI34_9ERIC|nr:haloacid dehalogenase-like hydrolase family protein [Actinidia rufa]
MAATSLAPLAVKMGTISQAYKETNPARETKPLISHLCRQFYTLRWVSGTASTITIKVHNDSIPKSQHLIVMSRSGVQKERMVGEDMSLQMARCCYQSYTLTSLPNVLIVLLSS